MRGFAVSHTRRPDATFVTVTTEIDPLDSLFPGDGRIAPVSRLASRFLDAIEHKAAASPGFAEGYRVQVLLDAVRRSHDQGRFLDTKPGNLP
jgi:predicted dehydrogenase